MFILAKEQYKPSNEIVIQEKLEFIGDGTDSAAGKTHEQQTPKEEVPKTRNEDRIDNEKVNKGRESRHKNHKTHELFENYRALSDK